MDRAFQLSLKYIFPSNPTTGRFGSIDLNLSVLQKFGLPLFKSQRECKLSYVFYGILVLAVFRIPYHMFEISDMILCFGNFDELIQNFCITSLHFGSSIKTFIVFTQIKNIYRIIKQFKFMTEKYVKTEEQKEVFFWSDFENKFTLITYAFMVGISCTCGMITLLMDPAENVGKLFPYRAKMPDSIPFSVQMYYIPIATFMIDMQIVGIDHLNVTFINLARCHLQMLNISFDELNEAIVDQVAVDPVKHLNHLMEHHTYILSICKQIEEVFKYPMLAQFVVSLLIFGMTGFQALVRSDTSGLFMIYLFIGCIMVQLLLYCWFGNKVSEQNKTLALRGYNTSWYNFDYKFRKSLVIFMLNAQKPLYFTAGGFVELSLMTFSTILSKSYSIIAILRQQYASK